MIRETLEETGIYGSEELVRETMRQFDIRGEHAKQRDDPISVNRLEQIDEAEYNAILQANFMFSSSQLILEARNARLAQEIATHVRQLRQAMVLDTAEDRVAMIEAATSNAIDKINDDAAVIQATIAASHKESLRDALIIGWKDLTKIEHIRASHNLQEIEHLVDSWSV